MGMDRLVSGRPARRELLVLGVGALVAVALVYAGWTLHGDLAAASERAAQRLAATVASTVEQRWQTLASAEEPPLPVRGELFRWQVLGERLEPIEVSEEPAGERSVLATLLSEAERLEVVAGDATAALALVREGLAKDPESPHVPRARVRAVQLAHALGEEAEVAAEVEALRGLALARGYEGLPCRLVAALVLADEPELARALAPSAAELEALFVDEDRLAFDGDGARLELAPLLVEACARLGLELPQRERRATLALARAAGRLPDVRDDRRWHVLELAGRPFLARHTPNLVQGTFVAREDLAAALAAEALPGGFALDLSGDREELGVAVHARTELDGPALAFTLRHAAPEELGLAEARRRGILRLAFFALGFGALVGALVTARSLARERELAVLRTSFIAGVSHDLRTPLAAILLLCENLESGVGDGPARGRYLAALRREAGRLRRLVDDVLDFARLERGEGTKLVREELELAPFVAGLSEELGERVHAAGRTFVHEAGELAELGALDAHAVRRSLENLTENALKHGAGTVTFASAMRDGALELALADEGRGIPPEARERVFEPFERLGAEGHVGGTGLGLAIVRAIARAHGGEARVGSNAGGTGARFTLTLPLEESRT